MTASGGIGGMPLVGATPCADGEDVEWIVLCDDPPGGGTFTKPFLRRIVHNESTGALVIDDFELDGVTPYVATGTVVPCTSQFSPPSHGANRDHFEAALAAQTTSQDLFVVPAGKIAHVVSVSLSAVNTHLDQLLQVDIIDGAGGALRLPTISGDASNAAAGQATVSGTSFLEPLQFSSAVHVAIVSGTVTYSVAVSGYLEDV